MVTKAEACGHRAGRASRSLCEGRGVILRTVAISPEVLQRLDQANSYRGLRENYQAKKSKKEAVVMDIPGRRAAR